MTIEDQRAFIGRLTPILSPSELIKVRLAYYLAKYGHRAQKRREIGPDGQPLRYFEHLRRTALNLIDGLDCRDVDMICAALLHDALEDTEEIDVALIEHAFGPEVARMVRQLSKKPPEGYHERLEACRDWRVLTIKLCGDRLDNLHSLEETPLDFQKRQIGETEKVYLPLLARLLELAPESYRPAIEKVSREIHDIVTEYRRKFQVAQS